MRRRYWLTYILTALAGTALHFAYEWLPVPLVGLVAPVNESVWEHLNLLYWPFLAASFVLTRKTEQRLRVWSGFLLAQLLMPLFLLGWYYLLLGGFAVTALWLDVGLFYVTLALGFWLARRAEEQGKLTPWAGVLLILAGLYGAALILFTLAPPELPIFTQML